MKTFVATTLAFASTTLGFVARQNTCCFSLTASGGASGVLGQLADGQNRVGGNYPAGSYCINGQGGLIDASGRGCILTRKSDHKNLMLNSSDDMFSTHQSIPV